MNTHFLHDITPYTNKKIETLLIILCVLFAPYRCYGFGALLGGNLTFFRTFGFLFIGTRIIRLVNQRRVKFNEFCFYILLIIFYSVFTLLYSNNPSNSHFYVMMIGLVWTLFANEYLMSNPVLVHKLPFYVVISAIGPAAIGIYQYIVYQSTRVVPSLPLSFLVVAEGKTGITYWQYLRITSTFMDPSYYGMFLVMTIVMGLGYLLVNKNSVFFTKRKRFITIMVLALCTIGILTTLSITAIVGLCVGISLSIIMTGRVKIIKQAVIIAIIFAIVLYGFNLIANINLIETVLFKLFNQTAHGVVSSGRSEFFANAIEKWLDNPIFGVGFGDLNFGMATSSAHNSFLTILSQQGIIGFILHFIFLIALPTAYYFHNKVRRETLIVYYLPILSVIVQSLGYDLLYKLDTFFVLLAMYISSFYLDSRKEHVLAE